jgi:hypothetical protein
MDALQNPFKLGEIEATLGPPQFHDLPDREVASPRCDTIYRGFLPERKSHSRFIAQKKIFIASLLSI